MKRAIGDVLCVVLVFLPLFVLGWFVVDAATSETRDERVRARRGDTYMAIECGAGAYAFVDLSTGDGRCAKKVK